MRKTSLFLALCLTGLGVGIAAPFAEAAPAPPIPVASLGSVKPAPDGTETYLVQTAPGAVSSDTLRGATALGVRVQTQWKNIPGMAVSATPAQAEALATRADVVRVVPDTTIKGAASGYQYGPTLQWNIDRLDQRQRPLNGGFTYTHDGTGVTAYVFDSGINWDHEDYAGRILDAAGADGDATDCNGHGTHVAATIAGTKYGVAKGVGLVPVKVLDCDNSGSTAFLVAAIDWAIGHHQPGVPAVANFSLASGDNPMVKEAINRLAADGITPVAAAGNDGADACSYSPANAPAAITVAATDGTDAETWFSNYGSCVDIYAPGENIRSAAHDSPTGTEVMNGTSMAAPHVTGAAALKLSANPSWTPTQVTDALISDSTKGIVPNAFGGTPNRLLHTPGITWPFLDVPPNVQFAPEMYWLADQGISQGWQIFPGGKEYRPLVAVNRDAMAAFMYRLAGSPAYTAPTRSPFRDISPATQFYKEMSWLASKGISTGWDVGGGLKEYRPLEPVNRDAMAAFMYRLAGSPAYTAPTRSPFRDITPTTQFYKEMAWLASNGISTGWEVGGGVKEYRPLTPVNRDAMAAFMYRLKVGRGLV